MAETRLETTRRQALRGLGIAGGLGATGMIGSVTRHLPSEIFMRRLSPGRYH
jgi:hypothetical protein